MWSTTTIFALILYATAGSPLAQQPTHSVRHHSDLHWTPTEIPYLQMAIVSGDPSKSGPYVLRLRATKSVRIPAHSHPAAEQLTVLSGTAALGIGDRFVESGLRPLRPRDHATLPKETRHFAQLTAGTEIQVHGDGPFTTNWVDNAAVKALKPSDVDSASERSKMKAEQDKK